MRNVVSAFSLVQMDAHALAVAKGCWERERNDGEMLAVIHSEMSEALEAVRHGRPADEHCPTFESYAIA